MIGKDKQGTYYTFGNKKYYYIKGNKQNKKEAIVNAKKYIIDLIMR